MRVRPLKGEWASAERFASKPGTLLARTGRTRFARIPQKLHILKHQPLSLARLEPLPRRFGEVQIARRVAANQVFPSQDSR